ncbi:hypothetical protein [Azospirillum endophyticum]
MARRRRFNPRSREGSDPRCPPRAEHGTRFNPRSREGSDTCRSTASPKRPAFQSTLPRRERQHADRRHVPNGSVSIHAPAKGATHGSSGECHGGERFQSTLPRRERLPLNIHLFRNPQSGIEREPPYAPRPAGHRSRCHRTQPIESIALRTSREFAVRLRFAQARNTGVPSRSSTDLARGWWKRRQSMPWSISPVSRACSTVHCAGSASHSNMEN